MKNPPSQVSPQLQGYTPLFLLQDQKKEKHHFSLYTSPTHNHTCNNNKPLASNFSFSPFFPQYPSSQRSPVLIHLHHKTRKYTHPCKNTQNLPPSLCLQFIPTLPKTIKNIIKIKEAKRPTGIWRISITLAAAGQEMI